ncbi:MAG: DUF4363 family protein [Clostridia bacterium]|nr:DUF4363 family protein [Clostridia bacterium]
MVKSIIYTLSAVALCIVFFIFVEVHVKDEFTKFNGAVCTLYDKVENEEVNREDAYAVRNLWENQKETLHIFLPHNDISYIDYWLNEACSLIYTKNYDLALGKLEVLKEISLNLPHGYTLKLENIF